MLEMSFLSFLTLTIIGAVVAAVYHWVFRYRMLQGVDSAFGKMIVGWVGAWVGSPVLGHWLWKIENVYLVPAVLGAIATIHLSVLLVKIAAHLNMMKPVVSTEEAQRGKATAA